MHPEHEKAQELIKGMGEIDQETALWIMSGLALDHSIKYAVVTRANLEDRFDRPFPEDEWDKFASSYEWRNLDEYMYDGAYDGIDFALSQQGAW
jgi:hypothetical protein